MKRDKMVKHYGCWAGNPKGKSEDPKRCIASIMGSYMSHQCKNKRGYGSKGQYCKIHAEIEAKGGFLP